MPMGVPMPLQFVKDRNAAGDMPDIKDAASLNAAIAAVDKAADPAAVRADCIKAAERLGLEELIPAGWTSSSADKLASKMMADSNLPPAVRDHP